MNASVLSRRQREDPLSGSRLDYLGWEVQAPPDGPGEPEDYVCIDRDLGGVRVLEHRLGRLVGQRSVGKPSDRYLAVAYFISGGELGLASADSDRDDVVHLEAGDVVAWHSDEALRFSVPHAVHKLTFMLPEPRLRGLFPDCKAISGVHVKANTALGPLLSGYLSTLARQLDSTPGRWSSAMMDMTLEMLSKGLAAVRSERTKRPSAQLMECILGFMEHHLSDSELCPAMIAAAHRISERYLHMLFMNSGSSVSAWIRDRRLARCAAALNDVSQDVTVTEIAFRWGFKDAAHFSRLFKLQYGMAPARYRELARSRVN